MKAFRSKAAPHSGPYALAAASRRLLRDRRGAVAPMFAMLLLPLLGLVGGAVDYTLASGRKVRLQNAVDAATLAATLTVTPTSTVAEITAIVRNYIKANTDFGERVVLDVEVNGPNRSVKVAAALPHVPYLLPIIGINNIPIGATSTSQLGRAYLEVALVLDNSGSMAGSRIETLRTASNDLARKVLDMAYIPGDAKVAVVPFASMVNVGAGNAGQSWIDSEGLSPVHSQNFSSAVNRLALYKQMNGVTWGGCVETRPAPHDVTDSAPTSANPATLFVPSFAPDEPDEGIYSYFYNSYIADTCSGTYGGTALQRQQRVCKYKGATPDQSLANGTRRGPNQQCDSNPVVPLTHNQTTISTALTAMQAYGGTNLHEGVMWGWRTLSPAPPFTEGRPYSDTENRKILVLMSDGANDHIGLPNMNGSFYSSYGYSAANRLGTTSSDKAVLVGKMNERTLAACANAKAEGLQIYTVAFYITDETALNILRQCASKPSMALVANSERALANAFDEIGNHIKRLRLTH